MEPLDHQGWWRPEGFRVDIHRIDPRAERELSYDMIAVGALQIAYMKSAGMPLSHAAHGSFVEIDPHKRLKISHIIDFIPGVEPYEYTILVEFIPEGSSVRMLVTVEPHHDEEWTRRAVAGFERQLTKLPATLAARRK